MINNTQVSDMLSHVYFKTFFNTDLISVVSSGTDFPFAMFKTRDDYMTFRWLMVLHSFQF